MTNWRILGGQYETNTLASLSKANTSRTAQKQQRQPKPAIRHQYIVC